MTAEEWRTVPGWPDYKVSNLGRVASHKSGQPKLLRGWTQDGYRWVGLRSADQRVTRGVHALVAAAFFGPRPEGQETRHLDGDGLHNELSNLAYGTHADNMQDRVAHGRHPMANKVECLRGHEFTDANTLVYRGSRFCRECKRIRQREYLTRRAFRAAGIAA